MYQLDMGAAPEGARTHAASASFSEEAHCRRVAALAREIARESNLPEFREEKDLRFVESVALLHHCLPRNLSEKAGLLRDALCAVHGVLAEGSNPQAFLCGEVVRMANSFDEMVEWLEFEPSEAGQLFDELETIASVERWNPALLEVWTRLSRDRRKDLTSAAARLPVSAVQGIRTLAATRLEDLSVEQLQKAAASDPVLAADLLRVVNSAANHTLRERVFSLRGGIVFLGVEAARHVLMSSMARGVFASGTVRHLWRHSLAVADFAQSKALRFGVNPQEAFLAGLLHDIGRIASEGLDGPTVSLRARLREGGAPTLWVDLLTQREDHAATGGRLLAYWGFADEIVTAVLYHHAPRRGNSQLAALLHLAEREMGPEEELPRLGREEMGSGLVDAPFSPRSYLAALVAA